MAARQHRTVYAAKCGEHLTVTPGFLSMLEHRSQASSTLPMHLNHQQWTRLPSVVLQVAPEWMSVVMQQQQQQQPRLMKHLVLLM